MPDVPHPDAPHPDAALLSHRFLQAQRLLPLVAILRGLKPEEAIDIGQALAEAGFHFIEVPLNSPDPFDSIERLRRHLPPEVLVGAGTVMQAAQLAQLVHVGADLAVMPHADLALIQAAKSHGLLCIPGVATPTEAFAALGAGADALKLFPAELVSTAAVKAMRAVLPPTVALLPVGGITPESMAGYRQAGANGFGLGSALYAPGRSAADVAARAKAFVEAWQATPP